MTTFLTNAETPLITGTAAQLKSISDIMKLGLKSNANSRVVRIGLITTSKGAGQGQASPWFHQSLNVILNAIGGGCTETPWAVPNCANAAVFSSSAKNGVADDIDTYSELQLSPGWGLGVGVGSNLQPQVLYKEASLGQGMCFVFCPSGETHGQEFGAGCGLMFPDDYRTVGIKGKFMMLKSLGSEHSLFVKWLHHPDYQLTVTAPGQTETIDTTALDVATPANPDPIVFTTANDYVFGSDDRGTMRIHGSTTFPDPTNSSVFAASKFISSQAKQYGYCVETLGHGGWSTTNFLLVTGSAAMNAALGPFDIILIEGDMVNDISAGATAQQMYDTYLPALFDWIDANVSSSAKKILYTTYFRDNASTGADVTFNTEYDKMPGVCSQLATDDSVTAAFHVRLLLEKTHGYTVTQQTLEPYKYAGEWSAAYAVDGVAGTYNNKRVVYHTPTAAYYWANGARVAADVPGVAAGWINAAHSTRTWAAGDLCILSKYANIYGQWLCRRGGAVGSATNAPPNPAYWGSTFIYPIYELAARVHAGPLAQQRFATALGTALMAATTGYGATGFTLGSTSGGSGGGGGPRLPV